MTGFFQFISNLIPSYLHKILCPLLAILCALLGLTVRDPHIEQPQQPETTTAIVETTTAPSTTVPATTEPTTTEVATTEPTTVPTTEVTTTEEPTTTEPPTTLAPLPTMQTRYSDMSYGEKSAQKMDVYLPEDINERREPYDVMIFLHGGFWCSGDKSSYSGFCATYAAQGYACVTMNYQLLSQYAFIGTDNGVRCQNMLDDMTAAITAIKNLLESNGRQVDKLALRGYSAGGHLSATYAYTCADISPIPIAFCVLDSGPTDLSCIDYLEGLSGSYVLGGYLGTGSFINDFVLYKNLFKCLLGISDWDTMLNAGHYETGTTIIGYKNPLTGQINPTRTGLYITPVYEQIWVEGPRERTLNTYARPYSPIDNISTAVPTIILCGSADQLVPPSQFGERLHTELDALGVHNSYFLFDGAGHEIFGATKVTDEVADYCELYF